MEGARYLEDGRLTIFKRSGIYLRTHSHFGVRQIPLAIAEDLQRADRYRSRPQAAVPNRTEGRPGPSAKIQIIRRSH